MANMLRSARGKLREIIAPRAAAGDGDDVWPTDQEIELETYKHAFETTEADRDRLAEEVEKYKHAFETTEADRDRLAAALENHEHASETMAAERDRLATDLETYRQAFETTEIDRDRIQAELDRSLNGVLRVRAGLLAHALLREVGIPASSLETPLARAWTAWTDDDGSLAGADIVRLASDGLIEIAETILRDAHLSELALDFVATALEISDAFRGVNHAVDLYFHHRKSFSEHKAYLETGVAAGLWPDAGTRAAQEAAIERGIPSILLATLPKSGSLYLWSTIAKSLEAPMFRVALPRGPTEDELVPGLVDVFAKGGLCAQQHLSPSPENIEILKARGIKRMLLHIRDPRQATVSWWLYNLRIGASRPRERSRAEIEEHLWSAYFAPAAKWVTDWIEIVDRDPDISIMLSTQEQLSADAPGLVGSILDFFGVPSARYSLDIAAKTDATHFRKGSKDEWLGFFSEDFKRRSTDLVPNDIAERFGWNTVRASE